MAGYSIHLINPIVGLTVNVILQVVSFRFYSKLSMLKSIILGFVAGFLVVLISDFILFSRDNMTIWHIIGIFLANLLTYVALGYCYFHFINLGETARRVRILREIYDSKDGLSIEEVLARYNAKDIIQLRMNRLLVNAQVILDRGKYTIGNPMMLYITRIILLLKLIVIGEKSEFD